jgi:hypothetical protein
MHISSVRIASMLEQLLEKHLQNADTLDDYQRGFADAWRQVAEFIRCNAEEPDDGDRGAVG